MISFLLHGWGSSAERFRQPWALACLPEASSGHFLDGLEAEPLTGRRRWFGFSGNERTLTRELRARAPDVEALIERELCAAGSGRGAQIALIGHSQGGMLALELALRARLRVAVVECFAAFLPLADETRADPRAARTRVYLNSSLADSFVGPAAVAASAARLRSLGLVRVEHRVATSLPHDFSADWLVGRPALEDADG